MAYLGMLQNLLLGIILSCLCIRGLAFHGVRMKRSMKPSDIRSSKSFHSHRSLDMQTTADWSFLDGVYLITTSLNGNQRLEHTKEQLIDVGIWDRVNVKVFPPDNEDRVRGCYTSHIAVLDEINNKYKNKPNYSVLILEDNLEVTSRHDVSTVESVSKFIKNMNDYGKWDAFHLGYMMYVPGLNLMKSDTQNIVQMYTDVGTAVGTSAYIISKSGVTKILNHHKQYGYTEAIPNVMALLFPDTRYAPYPMLFHRAASIGSLVNPQLDSFRKVMFSPFIYTTWERLLVSTGLSTNRLFPGLMASLFCGLIAPIGLSMFSDTSSDGGTIVLQSLLIVTPLLLALWGALLFNTKLGFAKAQG